MVRRRRVSVLELSKTFSQSLSCSRPGGSLIVELGSCHSACCAFKLGRRRGNAVEGGDRGHNQCSA
eukprot:15042663-Ditylum_brightwellii.AAC.1